MQLFVRDILLSIKNMKGNRKWQKSEKTPCTRKRFCKQFNTFNIWRGT